jgi:hypothetical protein
MADMAANDMFDDRFLDAARAARRAGHRDEAMRLFRAALDAHGEHPVALNALGMDALMQRDIAGAAALFRRAIAADGNAPDLWMNLAKAHREQGDDTGERVALEGALALDQQHFMALVRLAELHERRGETSDAVTRWGHVLSMAAAIDERSPQVELLLEHARDVVARGTADFASTVERGLLEARGAIDLAARRRFDVCIDHVLGRRHIYTNRCAGMHFPFLPADEFFARTHFPWFGRLEAATAAIRAELVAELTRGAGALKPYVAMAPGTPTNKWSPLDGSLAWGAMHLWKDGRRDDEVCARFPQTSALIDELPLSDLPGRTPTVFFSILQPGAHLPAHTGVSNVRAIVHLPLIVPSGCAFRVGGETREWVEGEAFAFDDTIEHEAWNRSQHLRAILILDVWNPHLTPEERDLLRRFYAVTGEVRDTGGAAIAVAD